MAYIRSTKKTFIDPLKWQYDDHLGGWVEDKIILLNQNSDKVQSGKWGPSLGRGGGGYVLAVKSGNKRIRDERSRSKVLIQNHSNLINKVTQAWMGEARPEVVG